MFILETLKSKAKKNGKQIVFPEGPDDRILIAVQKLQLEQLVSAVILGCEESVRRRAKELSLNLDSVPSSILSVHNSRRLMFPCSMIR